MSVFPADGIFLGIDWRRHGEEWVHHLSERMTTNGVSKSFHSHTAESDEQIPGPHIVFELRGSSVISSLAVVRFENGTAVAFVVSNSDEMDQIRPWLDAVKHASKSIGYQREFGWSAIIGVGAGKISVSGLQILEAPVLVGPLKLIPGGVVMSERAATVVPSLSGWSSHVSFPLIVEGARRGFSWEAAAWRLERR